MSRLTIAVHAGDHSSGPADAPVTLVEYGDYECPYCGEAYPLLKAVQAALGDRLRFVFRNFPLAEMHPHALHAAQFAEAAAAAGKFWEAHDMLYEHQDELSDHDLARYARELGLPNTAFGEAVSGHYDAKIEGDFSGGVRSGVNGTPTLFINGQRYDGPRDYDTLVDVLSQAATARQ
ncbi:MAG TPA: thioredoxin domain-containing protein [Stenotrophomonas sp.]|nr:thioredoxin domain-containing protein [Stenotrophomonas sp.]